jgi:hypothetical protein
MSDTIQKKTAKKTFPWLIIKIYFVVILILLLAWGGFLAWHTVHLALLVWNMQVETNQVQPSAMLSRIEDAADDINAIYQGLSPLFPFFNFLQIIPGIGPYLGQIDPLLTYADGLAQAGNEIALGLEPLIDDNLKIQSNLSMLESLTQVLESNQARFVTAGQAIDRASQARIRIKSELLPTSIHPIYLNLDEKFNLIVSGIQILQTAPALLGGDQPQSYLILAQNRDELRGTGGFISGIGRFTIQDGMIKQFELGDSYQIDDFSKTYPTPPEPLKRFMLADYWVTRDANWSPDFPTTSQQAQLLYQLSTSIPTQGVIAFNQLAVKRILEVIGPVQVPGTDEPVNAANVEDFMGQAWAPDPGEGLNQEWWSHRKDFMLQLGNAILGKVLSSDDPAQLLNLARTMVRLLEQGHVLVYFNDPQAQIVLEQGGWDGGLYPGDSDYLYLVDSNVGFNKVDSVIQRSLAYMVDLSDLKKPVGEARLTYQHTGSSSQTCKQEISYGTGTYQDMQQRCYLDFWRLYVPGGAEFLSSTAQPVPGQALLSGEGWSGQVESMPGEAGTQVFAGLLMLPAGQTSNITIAYILPSSIIHPAGTNLKEYRLRIQVQPGLDGLPFQLEIKLPDLAQPVNVSAGWISTDSQTWRWQGSLERSSDLSLSFQMSNQP